jgi:hypothetical protein
MGKFSDTLKEYNLSPELVTAFGTAESIFGTVSGAYEAYGTAYELGAKLGFWEGPTDLDDLADAIANVMKAVQAGFAVILKGQELQGQQIKIDHLLELKADALGALSILKAVAPGTSLTANQIDLVNSGTNCDVYLDKSLWTLPYYKQSAHSDSWSQIIEPPHDAFVRAFVIVLPRYLQAIALRLIGLAAAFPNPFKKPKAGEPAGFHDEIIDHAATLRWAHDEIREAIVHLRLPTVAEMLPKPSPPVYNTEKVRYWTLASSAWEKGQRLVGAVELYSTSDSIDTYPEPEPPPPDPMGFPVAPSIPGHVPPPNPNAPNPVSEDSHEDDYKEAFDLYAEEFKAKYYPRFLARHAMRSLREQKVVYNAVGLDRLWSAMNELRLMAGEDQLERTDTESVRDGVWSLREASAQVADALGVTVVDGIELPAQLAPLSIRALGMRVGIPSPFVGSLRQAFMDELGRVP